VTPLALELEAFTCYRQRALVEWEGSDSGLFAVTGPTGAGKSTLLDAITYALYGQTARLGGRGLESLLSPGAPSMFVQLKFRAARGVFRVTRVAQRKAGGVTTEVRVEEAVAGQDGAASWRQWQASESVRAANRAIEEIVGLDYNGFTRAVLLPQGAFDEFLRGDAGERRKLLVALLGLDRVERVRELASKLSREAEGVANGLERRLTEDYEDVSAEAIRALESHAATVKGEAAALELETNALDARLGVARERARLEGVLAALGRRREALAAASTRIAAVEKELAAARTAQALVPAIAAHERGADRAKSAALALEAAQSAATTLAEAATVARAGLLVAQNAHDERLPRLEGEQAAWQALAPALATLQRIGGDLTDLAEVGTGRMLVEEEWTLLQLVEGQLPHLARLESMAKGAADRVAAAAAAEAAASAAVATLKLELAERTAIGLRLKDEAQRLTAEREAAVMADAAAAVRAHVHVGDDCPVCGNRVSALPASGEPALAVADAAARKASEDLEAARAEYSRVNSSLAAASAKLTAAVSATSEARDAAVAATAAHEVAATALREQLAEAVDGDAATIDLGEAPALVAAARRAAVQRHARAVNDELLVAGVIIGGPTSSGQAATLDPRQALERLREELAALRAQLEAARDARGAAERKAERAADQLTDAEARAQVARSEADAAAAALATALEASGFSELRAAQAAVRDQEHMLALSALVDDHLQERTAVERGEVEARAELLHQPALPDPTGAGAEAVAKGLLDELNAARARRTALAADLGTVQSRLATARERLERKASLALELAAARAKFELHRQLALDLRSDRFQDYLMTHVQQRLARRASATLRHVTDGRYDLHLLDGDYLVADAWAGGELRSARTLSGGESFVASLALALALSDTLAGNASLGALFLDEGFGTLDRETLDSVTNVLEALTDEGRMVGVITHVTDLSERLPARLVVTKGQNGSTVAWDA